MAFDHDFGHSFAKRGKKKRRMNSKILIKSHAFLLDLCGYGLDSCIYVGHLRDWISSKCFLNNQESFTHSRGKRTSNSISLSHTHQTLLSQSYDLSSRFPFPHVGELLPGFPDEGTKIQKL